MVVFWTVVTALILSGIIVAFMLFSNNPHH